MNRPKWSELTVSERNTVIGELIGAEPLSRLELHAGGRLLWPINATNLEVIRLEVSDWQKTAKAWNEWKRAVPALQDDWRGTITVEVHTWHIRYSDTPAGGWMVVEALRAKEVDVVIRSAGAHWRVVCDDHHPHHGRVIEEGLTMQDAVCRAALRILNTGGADL